MSYVSQNHGYGNINDLLVGILLIIFSLFIPSLALAQHFQNNNEACQSLSVAAAVADTEFGVGADIVCDYFGGPSLADGSPKPSCITHRDNYSLDGVVEDSLYYYLSQAPGFDPREDDLCLNAGGEALFVESRFTNAALRAPLIDPYRLGSLASGRLLMGEFPGVAHPVVMDPADDPLDPKTVESLYANSTGGFSSGDTTRALLVAGQVPMPFSLDENHGGGVDTSLPGDESMLLMDCDQDGVDEAIVATTLPGFNRALLQVLQNTGSGLLDAEPSGSIPFMSLLGGEPTSINLAQGDFNRDGLMDVVASISDELQDLVVVCPATGACGFSCPANVGDPRIRDIRDFCSTPGACDMRIGPLAAGDFVGADGLTDIAVLYGTETNEDGEGSWNVAYLANDGDFNRFPFWSASLLPIVSDFGFEVTSPRSVDTGQFSEEAYASGVSELVINLDYYSTFAASLTPVQAFPSLITVLADGSGGIAGVEALSYFDSTFTFQSGGVQAADFDGCGGDDIAAMNVRNAFIAGLGSAYDSHVDIFLNKNEAPSLLVSADSGIAVGENGYLIVDCEDQTGDDREVVLSVDSGPGGLSFTSNQASLVGGATQMSTSFEADTEGSYNIRVTCGDPCDVSETILSIEIVASDANLTGGGDIGTGSDPGGTTDPEGNPINQENPESVTYGGAQGACVASLGEASAKSMAFYGWFSLVLGGVSFLRLRHARRKR
ncbi:MAG: hypothetical protein KDK66_06195 [Deltaproteobacteria bacterium]|nr:hypothetical protein [Deltaproteobacteria bacterium]